LSPKDPGFNLIFSFCSIFENLTFSFESFTKIKKMLSALFGGANNNGPGVGALITEQLKDLADIGRELESGVTTEINRFTFLKVTSNPA
jgi:hypothetical protein